MHFDFLIWPSVDVDGRVYDLLTIFTNYSALSILIETGGPKLASYLGSIRDTMTQSPLKKCCLEFFHISHIGNGL